MEDSAFVEDPVPQEVPEAPRNPDPPRYSGGFRPGPPFSSAHSPSGMDVCQVRGVDRRSCRRWPVQDAAVETRRRGPPATPVAQGELHLGGRTIEQRVPARDQHAVQVAALGQPGQRGGRVHAGAEGANRARGAEFGQRGVGLFRSLCGQAGLGRIRRPCIPPSTASAMPVVAPASGLAR